MAHSHEPPETGTHHVDHGDHGQHGHDDHGHGHGHGAPLGFEIIPESSGADNLLIFLAFACLLGLFAFAGIMITAEPHHEGGQAPAAQHGAAPEGAEKGAPPESHGTGAHEGTPSNVTPGGTHE